MRNTLPPEVEKYRIDHPDRGKGDEHNGCFVFRNVRLAAIVSNQDGWDHVSVSRKDGRVPTWDQMCWIKAAFFTDDEWVIQYHPARSDHIDYSRIGAPQVLHLWMPHKQDIPRPPKWMV